MQAPVSATNRKNLILLAFSLVVVMLGFGMVIPVLPFYIVRFGAGGSAFGLLVAIAALTEFLFGPVWGSISDQVGRKPILMIGLFGFGLSLLLFGLSTQLWMLYVSRALSGVLSSAALSTALAYIGDSTSEKERSGGMGLLGAAAGAGTIIGPGVGGLLAKGALSTPFFVGAAMALLSLLMVAFLLPESLPQPHRHLAVHRTPYVSFIPLLRAFKSPIGFLLFLAFFATLGTSNFESVYSLYMVAKLNYTTERIGLILTAVGVIALIGRGLLTGVFTKRWGEANVIKASLPAAALGFILLLQSNTYLAVLLSTGFFSFAVTFLRPSIHSLTSQRAKIGQGAALGMSNSCVSLGRIFGALGAGALFDLSAGYPYLVGAGILVIGLVFSLVWLNVSPGIDAKMPFSSSQ
ncbi:MAG TPA: MFS transporter [Anaerolineales bacterium]|nr:MFS transporter [Anaerolineales bacterium]